MATQRRAIELAARARGDMVKRWFSEKRSATTIARPELAKLREAARRGEVRRLYVFRLDRLSRSGIRETLVLLEELRAAGCSVTTVADGFDLSGPAAEVVIAVIAWAAQMERAALGERISAARARVEAEGRTWGRPRRASDAQVAQVRELRKHDRSIRSIAMALKIPRATVASIVARKGAYADTDRRHFDVAEKGHRPQRQKPKRVRAH